MPGVGDPRAHPALDLVAGHSALTPPVAQAPQAVAEAAHVGLGQAAPAAGQEDEAEEFGRPVHRSDSGLAGMEAQTSALQEPDDAVAPLGEACGFVVEEREVVHVAQVALGFQDFLTSLQKWSRPSR